MTDTVAVTDSQDASRFEARVGNDLAELTYRLRAGPALEGRGIGGKLVQAAVARAKSDRLTIVPLCPFAQGWLERHPDAASDVTIDWGDDTV